MIRINNLTKTFKLYNSPAERLKEILLGRRYYRDFTALKDIGFTVAAGETLGIIGQNGAGKSTLLKLLMGILIPDNGEIAIDGKISGLLELTIGFNPEFTGIQNIYMNGTLRGMSKQEIDAKCDKIVAFSELEDFINEPIKTYSSGMIMRLAFATAIHDDPQAFVVDEALSVGDAYFQQKCTKRLMEFKKAGGSLIFVSHDMNSVKMLSDKALLLDHGRIVEEGDPDKVINTYNFMLARKSSGENIQIRNTASAEKSYGNFKVEIATVRMINGHGQDCELFVSGARCNVQIELKARETVPEITVGILIRDKFGQDIFGTNTYNLSVPLAFQSGENHMIEYCIEELNIGPGKYTLTVAAHTQEVHIHECYHWVDVIKTFEVVGSKDFRFIGLSRLKPSVRIYAHARKTVIDKPLPAEACKAELSIENHPVAVMPDAVFSVTVKVRNTGAAVWPALGITDGKDGIKLAYHILNTEGETIIFDGLRTELPVDIEPQQEVVLNARVKAPGTAGEYVIEFDMTQELVAWFAEKGSKTARMLIRVRG